MHISINIISYSCLAISDLFVVSVAFENEYLLEFTWIKCNKNNDDGVGGGFACVACHLSNSMSMSETTNRYIYLMSGKTAHLSIFSQTSLFKIT